MSTSTDSELPGYAEITRDSALATSNLPSFVPSPFKSEYRTGLQDESGYAWLVLRVKSRSASAKNIPFFVEGDAISGVVELDVAKTDSVKAVFIEGSSRTHWIQAGTTAVGQEEERFLSLKETLWIPTGDKTGAKLRGKHEWPFQFVLPKEVEVVGPHAKKGIYQLPPSFSERASPAYLDYKIHVTIKRGMLKVNQKLTTTFVYQPITTPASLPTPLMNLAYTEGTPLPSPKQDAEGWKVFPKIKVEGILFGGRKVEIQCQLSIARPMQYALGSPISLHLVTASEDDQALDLLSSPTAIRIELVRAITTGSEATAETPQRRSDSFFTLALSRAYFWDANTGPESGPNRRVIQGEIDLETKLKPTFVFPRLSIEYSVNFIGFEATGWVSKDQGSLLLSEPVKVMSRQLAGVVMKSNAPPGYQRPEIDYNKSLGYLENGNQRFLHHGHW